MFPATVKLELINLTLLYTHALSTLRGDILTKWETHILTQEIHKIEVQVPDFAVVWCHSRNQFGLSVK
jgi:hypothetical protein